MENLRNNFKTDWQSDHSIYIRTVSSYFLLSNGTFVSFLTGLGQKSSVVCILLCLNKLPTRKLIIEKSRGEVSLLVRDTIENVS